MWNQSIYPLKHVPGQLDYSAKGADWSNLFIPCSGKETHGTKEHRVGMKEWPKAGKAAEPGLCHRQALRHGALLAVPGFQSTTLALAGFHHCTRTLCVLLIMGCDSYSLCYWRSGRDLLNSCKYYWSKIGLENFCCLKHAGAYTENSRKHTWSIGSSIFLICFFSYWDRGFNLSSLLEKPRLISFNKVHANIGRKGRKSIKHFKIHSHKNNWNISVSRNSIIIFFCNRIASICSKHILCSHCF